MLLLASRHQCYLYLCFGNKFIEKFGAVFLFLQLLPLSQATQTSMGMSHSTRLPAWLEHLQCPSLHSIQATPSLMAFSSGHQNSGRGWTAPPGQTAFLEGALLTPHHPHCSSQSHLLRGWRGPLSAGLGTPGLGGAGQIPTIHPPGRGVWPDHFTTSAHPGSPQHCKMPRGCASFFRGVGVALSL